MASAYSKLTKCQAASERLFLCRYESWNDVLAWKRTYSTVQKLRGKTWSGSYDALWRRAEQAGLTWMKKRRKGVGNGWRNSRTISLEYWRISEKSQMASLDINSCGSPLTQWFCLPGTIQLSRKLKLKYIRKKKKPNEVAWENLYPEYEWVNV